MTANRTSNNVSVFALEGPTATITSPASGGTYAEGQTVPTSFTCADSTYGPGIASCKDSNGDVGGAGQLNTAATGTYGYAVTATSKDGQTFTTSITYTIVDCSTQAQEGWNDGFNAAYNGAWRDEFYASYRRHGSWSLGFSRGWEAARFGFSGDVGHAAGNRNLAAARDPRAESPAAAACNAVFNAEFKDAFTNGWHSGWNSAFNRAFVIGYRAGFNVGRRH